MKELKPFKPSKKCLDLILEGMENIRLDGYEYEISGRDDFLSVTQNLMKSEYGDIIPKDASGKEISVEDYGNKVLEQYRGYVGDRVTSAVSAYIHRGIFKEKKSSRLISAKDNFCRPVKKRLNKIILLSDDASKKLASDYRKFAMRSPTRIERVKFEMKNDELYVTNVSMDKNAIYSRFQTKKIK